MNLREAAIRSLPQFGVTHSSQEVGNLLDFILATCLNFEPVNLLEDLGFLI